MKLSYNKFAGTAPKISAYQLPASFGQIAADTKLWSGELRPFFQDLFVQTVPNDTKSFYHYKRNDGEYVWLTWNKVVHVVKGPVNADTYNRIILSGIDGGLRVTDSSVLNKFANTVDTTNSYTLGVPAPTGVRMAVSGPVGANKESRSYVVALVREWADGKLDLGKTSAPALSPDTSYTVDVTSGQTVTLSNITIPANVTSSSGVSKAYVYRSVVGSTGTATYAWVGEFPINDTDTVYTYVDDKATSSLQESAVSLEWDTPRDDLNGLVSLNNGVMAAYVGTDVYFSYPYQPHAWPTDYRISVDYPIRGLGAFGNTVVVCTDSAPVLVLVTDPASATVKPIQQNLPCASSNSIVNTANGVIYATKSGLVLINSTAPQLITDMYLTKDEWGDWGPEGLISAYFDNTYFGLFEDAPSVYGFMYSLSNTSIGLVTINKMTQAIWTDVEEQELYMVMSQMDGTRAIVMFDHKNKDFRSFVWKSKKDVSPQGISTFSVARVVAAYGDSANFVPEYPYPYVPEVHTLNGVELNHLDINGPADQNYIFEFVRYRNKIRFQYLVDGILRYDRFVFNSRPFRLPGGFRGDTYEIILTGDFPVHYVDIATSMGELQ